MPLMGSFPQSRPGAKCWTEVDLGHGRGPCNPWAPGSGRVGSGGSQVPGPASPSAAESRAPRPPTRPGAVAPRLLSASPWRRTKPSRPNLSPEPSEEPEEPLRPTTFVRCLPGPVLQRSRPSAPNPRARRCRAAVARVKGRLAGGRGACAPLMRMRALCRPHPRRIKHCLSACAFLLQLPPSRHPLSCAIAAVFAMNHWAPSSQACAEGLGASSAQDASRTYSISPPSLGGAVRIGQVQVSCGRKYAEMRGSGNVGKGLEREWWKPERDPGQGVGESFRTWVWDYMDFMA